MSQRVNWVLDADIRSFFDSVDHEWLLRMVAHRIADPRILRLIGMWLEAGVLESNELHETERGTPQGSGISPLLANVFLHYVLDLWIHQWRGASCTRARQRRAICGRLRDGFESRADAERNLRDLQARLKQFGLTLHEEKTRLIEFGRLTALKRAKLGLPRPRTFAFLGFTHYCGWKRDGRFIVKHKTQSKRITRKLNELRRGPWRRMHDPLDDQHRWLVSVLRGHCAYYGMPHNWRALAGFRQALRRIWFTTLRRRSQRSRRAGWDWFDAVTARYPLPSVRITRSWRSNAYDACDLREEPSAGKPHARICEGEAKWPSYSTTILQITQVAEIDAGSTMGCRSVCLACGLTLTCLESKPSSRVITAHRMRAFLLAMATQAFCQPTRAISCTSQREIGSLRLSAIITAALPPWISSVRR